MISDSRIEVLAYDDAEQRQKWRRLIDSFENIDVFYYPEYCKLFELHGDGKPYLFVYMDPYYNLVIYPFLKRSLKGFLIDTNNNLNLFDITSPYGYSGYICNNENLNMEDFLNIFHDYCKENNIISEFIRFNPLLSNVSFSPKKLNFFLERQTVVIDLRKSKEDIWSSFKSNCRRNIKKALKSNVSIVLDDNLKDIDTFYNIYTITMQRLNAVPYYYFSRNWFYALKELLKDNVVIFHAKHEGKIINSALFIYNAKYIHYFLGGSLSEKNEYRGNNLLFYEATLWAKERGLQLFHLGGGYQPNDSLARFKESFSPYILKYHVGGVIHHRYYYDYLVDLMFKNKQIDNNINYFPLYRLSS